MKARILVLSAAALAVLCSSCRPIGAPPEKKNPPVNKLTPEEEAKKKEEEERKKAEEELKKKQEEEAAANNGNLPPADGAPPPPPPHTPPPTNNTRPDYPFANKVPGKDGFVFSPYNNKVIEVRDDQGRPIPSGTLVADPTYPPAEKKYFRVP